MPDPNDKQGKVWKIGDETVMRADDFRKKQAEELEKQAAQLDEVTRRYLEAQAAYFEALRAIPHADLAAVQTMQARQVAAHPQEHQQPVRDELTDHNYDGIQEYDNPTPGWWHMVFYGCIVFSVFYVLLVHFTPSSVWKTREERYEMVKARALEKQFAELNSIPMGEEKILKIMAQPVWLKQGETIFKGTCAVCHGQDGEGLVGPNLTDEVYKNAKTLMDIPLVISEGAANGAMPSQKNILNENEIALVAAYVASLRGKNLQGPRGPEGEPIAPWPTPGESGGGPGTGGDGSAG